MNKPAYNISGLMMGAYTPKYFKPSEWACKCGCGLDRIDMKLIRTLDLIRERFGRPIIITSGCRCEKHNATVGGRPGSAHLLGPDNYTHAVDILCLAPATRFQLISLILWMGIRRIEITNKHIHIDNANNLPQDIIDVAWVK